MVSLSTDREDPSNHHHCGGTLVSSHYVVTAASCVTWTEDGSAAVMHPSNLWVTIGEHRTSDQNETHMENIIGVANIHIHGGFSRANEHLHNIALLELDTVVNLYDYAPACLADTRDYFDGLMAQVYGFGVFDSDSEGTLHEANVTIVKNTECSAASIRLQSSIRPGILCAGAGGDTEKGPCEVRLKMEKSQQYQKQSYFRLGDTLTRGVL